MPAANPAPGALGIPCEHVVQFYETSEHLCRVVAEYFEAGLPEGSPCLMIGTPAHREGVVEWLRSSGLDPARLEASGRLRLLDARDALGRFMIGTEPSEERFRAVMLEVLDDLADGSGRGLLAFGEMVDLLWKDGNPEGAIRLEELWEELAKERDFSLLCAYGMENFHEGSEAAWFERICQLHGRILPAEGVPGEGAPAPPGMQVALLRQRSLALENEIARRARLEGALRSALEDTRRAEERLRQREHELRDFLENGAEGIHSVGADGSILWANRTELEMMGYEPEEYIGRHVTEFHVDPEVIREILDDLRAGRVVREREARLRRKDGSVRTVLINSNVLWRHDRFIHTRCFTRDITDRKRAEEAAVRARDEAEAANRAKSEFLAVMSHELRTPLNAILGYRELLDQEVAGPVTERQRKYFTHIGDATEQLMRLIEQVLSLSRVEAGKLELDIESVDGSDLVRDVVGLLEPGASRKGVELRARVPSAPLRFRSDANKVRQILLNLVSNAVKFTDAGHIEIRIRERGPGLAVEVEDTGPGIPAEDLERIFEPFVQGDGSTTRRHSGAGLGLAVSRHLARALGGRLEVAATASTGTVFSLELPSWNGDPEAI